MDTEGVGLMAEESIKNLKQRIKEAQARKESRRDLNESAYELAMPQRNLYDNTDIGDDRMAGVYTSLGISSVNNFVNNIQNSLTPPFVRWAEIKVGDLLEEEDETGELQEELDSLTKQIFTFINDSNFNTATAEAYYDLAVGTMALLVNKGDFEKPLNFQAVPIHQLALEEGTFGSVGAVFRKFEIAGRLIEQQWPDAKIPERLQKKINDNPSQKVKLDEVTYHDPDSGKYYYEILHLESEDGAKIVKRIHDYNPWIVTRWSKIPGEVEGRGPLLQALPDLKMFNNGKEMAITTAQMNAFGSYTLEEDGILDAKSVSINPKGFIIVKKNAGGGQSPSIDSLPRLGSTPDQQFFFETLEGDIKRIMMDNKLPPASGAVRSPTEIIERVKEFQVDFGSAFGRLMHEYIRPLFHTVMMILDEVGKVRIPTIDVQTPLGVRTVKITDNLAFTKIKMLSPVAKAQALEDVQNTVQAIQIMGGINPTLPLVAYKVEELGNYFADQLGMPEKFVRNEVEQQEAIPTIQQLLGGGAPSE
jgi:hypothetical protein